MFTDVGSNSSRNSAFSLGETTEAPGGNRANSTVREVLIPNAMLGRSECRINPWAVSKTDDCPCVTDAGFNVGDLRSYKCVCDFLAFPKEIYSLSPW